MAFTLRLGEPDAERGMHPVSLEELQCLAREHGAYVEHTGTCPDALGRDGVSWAECALRLPDDGTGALPLLRHVILNDDKSSTYKLALLRSLCRIADAADGLAYPESDGTVRLPLGLVGLVWIRLFLPLLQRGLPQLPAHDGTTRGLAFAKEGFQGLLRGGVAAMDLRVGMRFEGERAGALHRAVREAAQTIARMPAYYTTYPNGGQIFTPAPARAGRPPREVVVDEPFLWRFGELAVPEALWRTFQRFTVWVEPALFTEWKRLMARYSEGQGRRPESAELEQALAWSEPQRDVAIARRRVADLQQQGRAVHCIWSGRRLRPGTADIDHCFPWSAWPCDDLWNLLPASSAVNREKGARLPDAGTLQAAQDRIQEWWQAAYQEAAGLPERFRREAAATLAGVDVDREPDLDDVFSAVSLRRMRLKHDQRIPEWTARRLAR